ncbi:hypothetical protein MKW94_011545 [Papaver nudicaule]|uniref:Protein kinase domain-containing protein n=1 Tax=Papaver nudicaule TaxID=74823 RepID=A0AA41RST1_PAPNU|nr:hypothetical protein [Papaver nudicaule]
MTTIEGGNMAQLRNVRGRNMAMSMEVIQRVTENFDDKNIVGSGGFGNVYRGQLDDGRQVAVKRMNLTSNNNMGQNEFEAEIAVLTEVRHSHLVELLGYCTYGNERILVYEYMPQGALSRHLFEWEQDGGSSLTWKQRVTIALDVARGVDYLHTRANKKFIHRDIKPANILLGNDLRAKVSDFGLVRNTSDENSSVQTRYGGTAGYVPPEILFGKVTRKLDVYAFGAILMEMLTGRKALDNKLAEDDQHLVTMFRRKFLLNRVDIQNLIDPTLDQSNEEIYGGIWTVAQLAYHCTADNHTARPEMAQVLTTLAPLVEQWCPPAHEEQEEEEENASEIHMSLGQLTETWKFEDKVSTNSTHSSMVQDA